MFASVSRSSRSKQNFTENSNEPVNKNNRFLPGCIIERPLQSKSGELGILYHRAISINDEYIIEMVVNEQNRKLWLQEKTDLIIGYSSKYIKNSKSSDYSIIYGIIFGYLTDISLNGRCIISKIDESLKSEYKIIKYPKSFKHGINIVCNALKDVNKSFPYSIFDYNCDGFVEKWFYGLDKIRYSPQYKKMKNITFKSIIFSALFGGMGLVKLYNYNAKNELLKSSFELINSIQIALNNFGANDEDPNLINNLNVVKSNLNDKQAEKLSKILADPSTINEIITEPENVANEVENKSNFEKIMESNLDNAGIDGEFDNNSAEIKETFKQAFSFLRKKYNERKLKKQNKKLNIQTKIVSEKPEVVPPKTKAIDNKIEPELENIIMVNENIKKVKQVNNNYGWLKLGNYSTKQKLIAGGVVALSVVFTILGYGLYKKYYNNKDCECENWEITDRDKKLLNIWKVHLNDIQITTDELEKSDVDEIIQEMMRNAAKIL